MHSIVASCLVVLWYSLLGLCFCCFICLCAAGAEKAEKEKRLKAEQQRLCRIEEEERGAREPQWFPTLKHWPGSDKLLLQEHCCTMNSALTGTHFTLYDGDHWGCDKVIGSEGVYKWQGNEILIIDPNNTVLLKFMRSFTATSETGMGSWLIKGPKNELLGTLQIEVLFFGMASQNYKVEFGSRKWYVESNTIQTQYTITEGHEKIAFIDQGSFGFFQADQFNSYTIEVYDRTHLVLVTGIAIAVDTSRDLIRESRRAEAADAAHEENPSECKPS